MRRQAGRDTSSARSNATFSIPDRLRASADGLIQDGRMALRTLRRSPTFAAAVVLTLSLGIGANTAIFGVVNSLLLRPVPIADPDRLVTISSDSLIARGHRAGFGWSYAMWERLQPHLPEFAGAIAWVPARFDLAGAGERQPVDGMFASGAFFATLGVGTSAGRTFTAEDDRPGGGADGPVAVISHGLWQRRFGGAASAIGGPLVVDGVTVTVIGVMPPAFSGLDVGRRFDVALPLESEPVIRRTQSRLRTSPLLVMLRLLPGQSSEAGTAILRGLQPQILGVARDALATVKPAHYREPFTLVSAATGTSLPVRGPSGLRQTYERPLRTIQIVVLLVLVLACVNIANLLLARVSERQHNLAVNLALGAPRSRLTRQLLMESLALAALGTVGGLLLASWGSRALVAQLSTTADRLTLDLSLDWRVLTFTTAVGAATAAIFGTVPAFHAVRVPPIGALKAHGRAGSRRGAVTRSASLAGSLTIVQIALSLALVVTAGLLVRSFARLVHVPLGFDPDRVLVVNVDTSRARVEPAERLPLFQRLVDRVAAVPGVAHAGGSIWTPVDGGMRMGDPQTRVSFNFVTPGWFGAYGTTIRMGRDFRPTDTNGAPPVVIVNDAFVRTIMGGRFPIGEAIPHPRVRNGDALRTIVGVVADTVFESQRDGIQSIVYVPVAQSAGAGPGSLTEIGIGVRPAAGPPRSLARSVGEAVAAVDPGLSYGFVTLTEHVQASVRHERVVAMLSGLFGALALFIAALGLYGLVSHGVNQRVREIGIRMALGAPRSHVLGLVLGQSVALTVVGIGAGMAAAAAVSGSLRGMLFGLTPLDPGTFAGVAALFALVTGVAAAIPARRATLIDPLVALRSE